MTTQPALDRDEGTTILEVVMVLGLLLVFLTSTYRFVDSIVMKQADASRLAQNQAGTRLAYESLVRELRQATSAQPNVAAIELAAPTQIRFLSPDRVYRLHLRRIQYQLTGAGTLKALQRSATVSNDTEAPYDDWPVVAGFVPVLDRVTNTTAAPIFRYRDNTGAFTTNLLAIATVEIDLQLDPTNTNRAPSTQRYTTKVELRVTP